MPNTKNTEGLGMIQLETSTKFSQCSIASECFEIRGTDGNGDDVCSEGFIEGHCGTDSESKRTNGTAIPKTVRKLNSDVPFSDAQYDRSISPEFLLDDDIKIDRLHLDRGGSFRRSSSTDHLGITQMRQWLRNHGLDPDHEPQVLTDAYIHESMSALKDGRSRFAAFRFSIHSISIRGLFWHIGKQHASRTENLVLAGRAPSTTRRPSSSPPWTGEGPMARRR
jgi:hypothetical protein